MEHIFLAAFIAYILAMIAIGWLVSRKQQSGDDFLLAGRNVPLLLSLGTTVATMVGTGSSMGAVGFAYYNGWAGTLYGLGGATGILLLAWLFAPVRRLQFTTMSEEIAYYVDNHPYVKNIIAFIIYAASIGWLGAHIIGGGMYLSWLTGLDISLAKVIIALSFSIYIVIGGYTAVIWTDSIQALILFVGFILMAYFSVDYLASEQISGWQNMLDAQPVENISFLALDKIGVLPAFSLAVAILVGVLATPSFRQRIYSGKNVSSIRKSFIYSGLLYLGFSLIPAILGMSAYAMTDSLENPAYAFPHIALHVLPVALGILIIIAGISATLSSASSDAIAGVSVLLTDLYQLITGEKPPAARMILFSRVGLVFTIITALLLALMSNNIISYITSMIAVLMSGMCACGLLGRLWSKYTWQGAIASLFFGMLGAITITWHQGWYQYWGNAIIPAMSCALFAGIVVSMITYQKNAVSQQTKGTNSRLEAEFNE
ncbi:sodium:solute symporter family protein [Thalassotalea profundi]|uniref:Sodium:proline symporter n=1 Tax=Thalassotalea profundi TaxID=2036687 RepID=A0ABQ3IZ96_9GAMM|nr:sodium:solute symporter family protein [Thalassotalea profundi]GHE99009.1 sodium:proline symporter [Thalassotalea profundi]